MAQSYRNARTGYLTDILVDTTPIGAIVPNLKTGQNSYDHSFVRDNANQYPGLNERTGNSYISFIRTTFICRIETNPAKFINI